MNSQGGEEAAILRAVEKIEGDHTRTFLDIGAHDGKSFSNTYALALEGWRGVCIEPSPAAFIKLIELYKDNPRITLVNAAIGLEDNLKMFYDCGGDFYGSLDAVNAAKWVKSGIKFISYLVPQITIEKLIHQLPWSYDVVSIDTEGTSFDILKTIPLEEWDPTVICIEHDGRAVEVAEWGRATQRYEVGYLDANNICLVRVRR